MNVAEFDYDLPPDRIAQTPIEPRHASRLMLVNRQTGQISHHRFSDIVDILHPNDLLIANNSRVIPARLFGRKSTGGQVEILLLKQRTNTQWEVLVGGKRLKPGVSVEIEHKEQNVNNEVDCASLQPASSMPRLTIVEDLGEARRLVEFDQPINDLLGEVGHVPLPPYIHEVLADKERYQTVFNQVDGSSAAPTAGLHFTPQLLLALRDKQVKLDYVTLHIGLDTFKPITVETVAGHHIHREIVRLSTDVAQRINQTKLASGRIVAVGTTSMRTLETAGLRAAGYTDSLQQASLFSTDRCGWKTVIAVEEETDLFIYPGYTFRAVDLLLTNFHLPKSTLLMLVSAFAGTELIREAYQLAIEHDYRFFSFGDAMLII